MGSKLSLNDVQIVVERRGFGSSVWFWRLIEDRPASNPKPLHQASSGYRSAQCAYEAAQAAVRQLQLEACIALAENGWLSAERADRRRRVPITTPVQAVSSLQR